MEKLLYKVFFSNSDGEEDFLVSTSKEEVSKSLSFLYPEFDGMDIIWSNVLADCKDCYYLYGVLFVGDKE